MRLIYLDFFDKEIGTLEVQNGKAVMTGAARGVDKTNVIEPDTFAILTPKDGDRWLDAVRYLYRSGYVRAVIANDDTPAQKADVSKNPGVFSTHKPGDQDLVGHATGLVRSRWLQDAGALIEPREWLDELSVHDINSIVEQVADRWDSVYATCQPLLLNVVDEAVQRGMISMPNTVKSVESLKALGAEWLDSFAKTMIRRWVGERIRDAVSHTSSLEAQSLAVVKAVEQVPDAFSIVLQPMIRRLLAFGAVMQEIERTEPRVTVQKAREQQQYVIVTAEDKKVCQACEYLSEVGPFWLRDALDLFDNFIEAVQEENFAEELLSREWMSESEIVGLTRTELKALGQIVPPFHPNCRCGIAFVRA